MPSVEFRHTGTYKVVAEYVAAKKEGEVKLYVENEEGMTKPKQGKNKPPLVGMWCKTTPRITRPSRMSMMYVYLSQFCVSARYTFTVPCLPLFRTSMMGLPSQLSLLPLLKLS